MSSAALRSAPATPLKGRIPPQVNQSVNTPSYSVLSAYNPCQTLNDSRGYPDTPQQELNRNQSIQTCDALGQQQHMSIVNQWVTHINYKGRTKEQLKQSKEMLSKVKLSFTHVPHCFSNCHTVLLSQHFCDAV